mmetsp:Transcript_79177/g.116004  ORF Transcript_79177/g.116004 Transcript_79177/m.116004 type:complete len:98 (-) Transcript_79177:71-364(-)
MLVLDYGRLVCRLTAAASVCVYGREREAGPVYTNKHVCIYICVYTYTYMRIYIHISKCFLPCMYVCMYHIGFKLVVACQGPFCMQIMPAAFIRKETL